MSTRRPACTGVAAVWCPRHGDCTCPYDEATRVRDLNDPACPLHAPDSHHAENPAK